MSIQIGGCPDRLQLQPGFEPIPGYVLEECVGAGGYGQVWRASAPGGLVKALKFVFGRIEEAHATRELKSLDRVKQLQHPFLLSLERIELLNEQLLIVMELARCSLRERFLQCGNEGKPGIPRDELLTYMRNVADALDYLEGESLQHLDVKPENLLLVGNHIKLSDFGLIKDLTENVSISLIDGLTPKYSPPELLDNRPDSNSDQYSLALVYQEMLTGTLPYEGVTPAQLATQHLHGSPDLSPSPPADRFALRKALSKDPNQRFGSCTEFVSYLLKPPKSASVLVSDFQRPIQGRGRTATTATECNDGQTMPIESSPATGLPPLDLSTQILSQTPTLIIGVGGSAANVLVHVRRQLDDRYGGLNHVPAIQMLLMDTDHDAVRSLEGRTKSWPLNGILPLPLRDSGSYRQSNVDGLASISRRWMYNIPRSRKTEGLRALGRLAFLDHAPRVLESLRSCLRIATAQESIEKSAKHTGLSLETQSLRVFVVASISGGTGSGIVVDLGYALRQVLAELCLSDEGMVAILMHNVPSGPASRTELAIANSYACLRELHYFSRHDTDYPGEPSINLAGFRGDTAAFPSTYVVGQGAKGDNSASRDVADYLYLNCATRAGLFFETCRQQDDIAADAVRTFGIHSLASTSDELIARFANRLCRKVLTQWRGGTKASVDDRPTKLADMQALVNPGVQSAPVTEQAAAFILHAEQFSIDALIEEMYSVAADILGAAPDEYFRRLVENTLSGDGESVSTTPIRQTVDAIFGDDDVGAVTLRAHVEKLPDAFAAPTQLAARRRGETLVDCILALATESPSRLDGTLHGMRWTIEQLSDMRQQVTERRSRNDLRIKESRERLAETNKQHSRSRQLQRFERIASEVVEYGLAKLHNLQLHSVATILQVAEISLSESVDDLANFWEELSRLRGLFPVNDDSQPVSPPSCIDESLWRTLLELEQDLADQLDERYGPRPVDRRLAFERLDVEDSEQFAGELNQAARQLIIRGLRQVQGDLLRAELERDQFSAEHFVRQADPRIGPCGGQKRMMLLTSEQFDSTRLADEVGEVNGHQPTVVRDGAQDFFLCNELGHLTLSGIANHLVRHRADLIETAKRLRTRVNVDIC